MDKIQKKELRARKKAYQKAFKKAIRPWKGLCILMAMVLVISSVASVVVGMFDNIISLYTGNDKFWSLENEDPGAQYFASDLGTAEEKRAYEEYICEMLEAEGAVLLMNKDNTLPLNKGAKVSCFSGSSVDLVYGGTGSGIIDTAKAATLKSALMDSGFAVNETLWNFYLEGAGSEYRRTSGNMFSGTSATVCEVPWDVYPEAVKRSVESYGDAAIIVLSRVGGEGADLPHKEYNALELNEEEKTMLSEVAAMKAGGTVGKMIVLINSANALQVDFLQSDAYGIDACLWIGDVGETGINAVADILAGDVNPSGRLVDTYCYDNYSAPAIVNFGASMYTNAAENGLGGNDAYYILYQEGIYVGYRYYETRYEDYVMGTGNAGDYAYGMEVAYPFGYGLSYTTFAYSNMNVRYNAADDMFEITLTVTNTGDVAGKETVQIYAQSPYTEYDIENRVEKPAVILCGFDKTGILEPGQSETVTVPVDKRDLASYDAYGAGTYILDDGTYYLTAAKNAHDAVNNILAAKGYTTAEGRMDADGNTDLVYRWVQEAFDATSYAVSEGTGYAITNQFDHADITLYNGLNVDFSYLTRSDWAGTYPSEITSIAATEQLLADLAYPRYDSGDYPQTQMPVMGADNGLTLYDMMGLDYEDPQWELLLDQLTFEEMESQIGDAFHWTLPIISVQAPGSRDENGPQGLTVSLLKGAPVEAIGFTSEDIMAATFHEELIYEVGRCIGADCLDAGVSGLYGTGNNIHRTPFSGRNFEYYSEDPFLSGRISLAECTAIESYGVDVMLKHFALNDCEERRMGLGTWANEQSIREIYLKAFQAPLEEGDANGVMNAYNRLGAIWCGGNYNLLTNVLRNEWGCNGRVITDNCAIDYMTFADAVMAGGTIMDAMTVKNASGYENDPVVVNRMREAVHRNLYSILTSGAMNGVGEDTVVKANDPFPLPLIHLVRNISAVLFVVCLVLWIVKRNNFIRKNGKKREIHIY